MLRTTLVSIFTFALLTGMPVGCTQGEGEARFRFPVPQDRLAVVAKARRTGDENAVEPLIRMLASDDPLMRLVASDTLVQITGEDFGYDPAGSDPRAVRPLSCWANWFTSKKDTPSGRVDP